MKLLKNNLKQPFKKLDTKMSFFILTCIGFVVIICYCLKKDKESFSSRDPSKDDPNIWNKLEFNKGPAYCGRHFAGSCKLCPYDSKGNYMGKDWCNGSCKWDYINNHCADKLQLDSDGNVIYTNYYKGKVNKTASGKECQKWNKDTPHRRNNSIKQAYDDENNKYDIGDHNYCRSYIAPNASPWCYTTDPNVEREYCNIDDTPDIWNNNADKFNKGDYYCGRHFAGSCKLCPYDHHGKHMGKDWCNGVCKWNDEKNECVNKIVLNSAGKPTYYEGKVNKTATGIPCQNWTEDSPYKRTTLKADIENKNNKYGFGNHNFCRTYDKDQPPGCFTLNTKRWEFCNIDDEPMPVLTSNNISKAKEEGERIGRENGYNEGYIKGKSDGIIEGENDGYIKGKRDGIIEGESDGYSKGTKKGTSNTIDKIKQIIRNKELIFNFS